jgi:hypothetical protein
MTFYIHGILHLYVYEDGTECSETSACKIQTPENYPEESIQHSEHGESLKSRILLLRPTPLPDRTPVEHDTKSYRLEGKQSFILHLCFFLKTVIYNLKH